MTDRVTFRGDSSGLIIEIDEALSLAEIKEALSSRLKNTEHFFRQGAVRINLGSRSLSPHEKEELISLFNQRERVLIVEFLEDKNGRTPLWQEMDFSTSSASRERKSRVVKKTLRSGQRVELDANLILMGDVNPGAEIVVSGDIFILGSLRGMAHAGAGGNREACVFALTFKPTQLRIASLIARSPEEGEGREKGPEIARIKEDMIVVEPYNSRGRGSD